MTVEGRFWVGFAFATVLSLALWALIAAAAYLLWELL